MLYCRKCTLRQFFERSDALNFTRFCNGYLCSNNLALSSSPAPAPVHSLQWLLRSGAKLRVRMNEPKGPACNRVEKELATITCWRGKFADILVADDRSLCSCYSRCSRRYGSPLQLAGSAKSRTLKKMRPNVATFANWLQAFFQASWPSSDRMVSSICGRTAPAAFLTTLAFLARAQQTFRATFACPVDRLSPGSWISFPPPWIWMRNPANRSTAALNAYPGIRALQWMLRDDASCYSRAFAWATLVKFWFSCRCDVWLGLIYCPLYFLLCS